MIWPTAALGDLVEIVGGGTPARGNPAYWGRGIPWATVKDLDGLALDRTAESITQRGLEESASRLVPAGSVVLATRVGLGKVAINSIDLAINQDLKALRCREGLEPRYLLHFLTAGSAGLERMGQGSTVKGITLERLLRLEIRVPPVAEQHRIAAVLDQVSWIRGQRTEAIGLLTQFVHSSYLALVGFRAPGFCRWPMHRVEELAASSGGSIRTGPFGSALRHSEFVSSGVAILGIDNAVRNRFAWDERRFITPRKYDAFRRYTVHPGDVIVTIMGTTGRTAVVPDDIPLAISTKHLAVMTVDRGLVHPEYLAYAIRGDPGVRAQIVAASRGAIMAGLNLRVIRGLRLRLPPLEAQLRFARIVAQSRLIEDGVTRFVAWCGQLSESLARRAFAS